jgi:hypothetical protein
MKIKNIILFFTFISIAGISYAQNQDSLETDPVNISAMAVINRYLYAIGGKEAFENVKDRTTVMTGTAMEQPINIIIKQKYPDMLFQELQAGEVKQFLYYKGGKGTMILGDEKINLEERELERLMMDATMHMLLSPDSFGVKSDLMGIECLDSIDCYTIRLVLPSGIRWFQYYAVDTGLKVKEIKEIQTRQGLFEQETYFSDYREVSGLKFPFTIKQYFGIQEIDLTVTTIEINIGLEDQVFRIPE